jgi:hypothetical protein
MKVENLRSLIRESINDYIREIDNKGNEAALQAKIDATQEAIELREKKMNMDGLDEAYHDMLDKGKMKELSGEVKALNKSLTKLQNQLNKLKSKSEPKAEVVSDGELPADEVPVEEIDITSETELEEARSRKGKDVKKAVKKDEEVLNESFLKMQKLAGVITESEYKEKINETLFLFSDEKMKKGASPKEYTDKEIEDMSLEAAKKLYKDAKNNWNVPHNHKLAKRLQAKIDKEDSKK